MLRKVNLGLDIGITSVGWSILDAENFEIIKHGVRLFPQMDRLDKLQNKIRREKRSMRRIFRRRSTIKKDFISFLIDEKWINIAKDPKGQFKYLFLEKYIIPFYQKDAQMDILNLRQKGLTKSLTKSELILVLYWYLSTRGYKYHNPKGLKEVEDVAKKLDISKEDLEELHPVKIQLKFMKKHGFFRGNLNRLFSSKNYQKEIEQILQNSKVNLEFQKKFLEMFERQRSYELGPGSQEVYFNKIKDKKSLQEIASQPYNRFYWDAKTKTLKAHVNMWETSIGKCVYDNNFRAPKNCLTAELFNLLNDLNNIKIGDNHLTKDDKLKCIDFSITTKSSINKIVKFLTKKYDVSEDELSGLRISKIKSSSKVQKQITELSGLHVIQKSLRDSKQHSIIYSDLFTENGNFNKTNIQFIDKLIIAVSKSEVVKKRLDGLRKIVSLNNISKLNSDKFLQVLAKDSKKFNETHSLSSEFIWNKMLENLLNENQNQMQIIENNKIQALPQFKTHYDNPKYLSLKWIEDLIASPTTKRSIRQALKVVNRIIKLHYKDYKIQNVVIEMARDLNAKSEKESQKSLQGFLEQRRKEIASLIESIKGDKDYVPESLIAKVWLYEQQKGYDAYSGERLDINQIVNNRNYVDIDHIIPHSQSFNDSRNNKVLVLRKYNSEKGNRTPYQYISTKNGWGHKHFNLMLNKWNDWYNPLNNKSNDRKGFGSIAKLRFIVSTLDYSDPKNAAQFINRNLVDTRYVTKEVLREVKNFVDQIKKDHMLYQAQVKTVNGRFTSFVRKMVERNLRLKNKIGLARPFGIKDGSIDPKTGKKDRIWNGHHAEDAVIVVHAALKNNQLNKFIEKMISNPYISDEQVKSWSQKEMVKNWDEKKINFEKLGESLNLKVEEVKFSYMLTKKTNTQLFNETIYKGKLIKDDPNSLWQIDYVKLEDLNSKKNSQKAKEIFLEGKHKVLMKEYDEKTFAALKEIYEQGDEKSPFKLDGKGRLKIIIKGKKINLLQDMLRQ